MKSDDEKFSSFAAEERKRELEAIEKGGYSFATPDISWCELERRASKQKPPRERMNDSVPQREPKPKKEKPPKPPKQKQKKPRAAAAPKVQGAAIRRVKTPVNLLTTIVMAVIYTVIFGAVLALLKNVLVMVGLETLIPEPLPRWVIRLYLIGLVITVVKDLFRQWRRPPQVIYDLSRMSVSDNADDYD